MEGGCTSSREEQIGVTRKVTGGQDWEVKEAVGGPGTASAKACRNAGVHEGGRGAQSCQHCRRTAGGGQGTSLFIWYFAKTQPPSVHGTGKSGASSRAFSHSFFSRTLQGCWVAITPTAESRNKTAPGLGWSQGPQALPSWGHSVPLAPV